MNIKEKSCFLFIFVNTKTFERTTDAQFGAMGRCLSDTTTEEDLGILTEEQRNFVMQTLAGRILEGTGISLNDFVNALEGRDRETFARIARLDRGTLQRLYDLGFDVFNECFNTFPQ